MDINRPEDEGYDQSDQALIDSRSSNKGLSKRLIQTFFSVHQRLISHKTSVLFYGVVERVLSNSLWLKYSLILGRGIDGKAVLLRCGLDVKLVPGDVIKAKVKPLKPQMNNLPPLLAMSRSVAIERPTRKIDHPDLSWIVSLLEAVPTHNLIAVVDPETLDTVMVVDALSDTQIDQNYHEVNARLMAETVARYWGPTESVQGRAATPGVKHYGKLLSPRVRRSIMVPYDSLIDRTAGFHGFSLTGTKDIVPIRLLSSRGDRLLSAAHETGHMLESWVGIWPEQYHLSECFADAFAILAVMSRPDATVFAEDLLTYRDMRLIGLLSGDSSHATGLAVAKALAIGTFPTDVVAIADIAFDIASRVAGDEGRLQERRAWVKTARQQHGMRVDSRSDHADIIVYRAHLDAGVGSPHIRSEMNQALKAFDRIGLSETAAVSNPVAMHVLREDLMCLIAEAGTRQRALMALARARAAHDRWHTCPEPVVSPLAMQRAEVLLDIDRIAREMPDGDRALLPELMMVHIGHDNVVSLPLVSTADDIIGHFIQLSEMESQTLADREGQGGVAAGRILRQRIDFSISVICDKACFNAVKKIDPIIAKEIQRLSSAPVPLLVQHNHGEL